MTTRTVSDELVELDAPFAEFFRTLTGPWPFRPLLALTPASTSSRPRTSSRATETWSFGWTCPAWTRRTST